jgi:hypothetical protein
MKSNLISTIIFLGFAASVALALVSGLIVLWVFPILIIIAVIIIHRKNYKKTPSNRIHYDRNKERIFGRLLRDDGWRGHSIYLVIKEDTGKTVDIPYNDDNGAPLVKCDFCYYPHIDKIEFDVEYELFREKFYLVTDPEEIRSVMEKVEAARNNPEPPRFNSPSDWLERQD